jgi:hypothetical protein
MISLSSSLTTLPRSAPRYSESMADAWGTLVYCWF